MAVDPYFDKVELLLHMDGDNGSTLFRDNSKNAFPVATNGTAQVSTSLVKFGTGSGYFDGTSGYLDTLPSSNFNFGTGDFTVEFWFRSPETRTGGFGRIIAPRNTVNATGAFQIWHSSSTANGSIIDEVALAAFGGTAIIVGTSTVVTPLGWCHIAFTRRSNVARCFLNGVLKTSTSSSQDFNLAATEGFRIGGRGDLSSIAFLKGNLDDLRITKGYARYVENFTVPTAAFGDEGSPDIQINAIKPEWRRLRRAI